MKNIKIIFVFILNLSFAKSITAQHWRNQDNFFLYENNWVARMPQNVQGFVNATNQIWSPVAQSWTNTSRLKNTYTTSGRISSTEEEIWRNNAFATQTRYYYSFNLTTNNLDDILTQNAANENVNLEVYNYVGDYLMSRVTQYWNASRWNNAFRDSNVYQNGRLYMQFPQEYFTAAGLPSIWGGDRRDSIVYDNAARTKTIYQQAWIAGRFLNAQRDIITYDALGKRTELRREFIGDVRIDSFYPVLRWVYAYNAQGQFQNLLRQQWNRGNNRWEDYARVSFNYGANGKITSEVVETLVLTGWQNQSRTLYLHTTNNTNELNDEIALRVFPNPATNTNIVLDIMTQNINIENIKVYDMLGRCVKTYQNMDKTNQYILDTKDLEAGSYVLYVKTSKGIISKKINIQQ